LGDTSKTKPVTLVLHSALDWDGAYHRDSNMTNVLKDTRNLTLLIEGVESIGAIKGRIDPLAQKYGKGGVIDQVMIAGHGDNNAIELGGKMAMGDDGKMDQKGDPLKVGDANSQALIDELLGHMDPSSPNHTIVFNACLTNSNAVESA